MENENKEMQLETEQLEDVDGGVETQINVQQDSDNMYIPPDLPPSRFE